MKLKKEYYQNFKTRKRIYPIQWSSGKGENVICYATSHHSGEIDILSGKLSKSSYPSDLINKISTLSLISSENDGNVIACFLVSCEIVLYNKTFDKCLKLNGPSHLKNCRFHVSLKKSFNPIEKFNVFIKKYNNREVSELTKEIKRESPEESRQVLEEICYKPKIFTSSNLSKIFLILNNTKVFFYSDQRSTFKNSDDQWEVFVMPEVSPSQKDRETTIDVSSINTVGGSFSCISFCFFSDDQLNLISLLLQENFNKYGTKTNHEWIRKNINLGFHIKRKNSLLLKISPDDSAFCVVVNTYGNNFHLLYGHFNLETVAVVDCPYPVKDLEVNNRFQWVSCIDWIANSNFIIGCLRSGYIFISSRFGRLLKIEWSYSTVSDSIAEYFINIFPEFNVSRRNFTQENEESESETTTKTNSSSKPKFSLLASPCNNRIAVCSGFGVCLFTLPENILSNEGMQSFLLENTHRTNHFLGNSLKNHEYDFIHFSNWRLASSEHHNQNLDDNDDNLTVCSLWYPRNIIYEKCKISPAQTELELQKEDICLWLKVIWSFLASRNFEKSKRKLLIKATISETIKLFQSLVLTSSNDGEEHQASLLQCLRIFHQILQYCLAVSPCAYKAVNAFLQLLYRLLNLVMKSAKAVSTERKLICILILTQTLVTVKSSFMSADMIPQSHFYNMKFESILDFLMVKHWMYLYKSFLHIWEENKVQNSHKMRATQTIILNIIQDSVRNSSLLFCNAKLNKEYRMFFSGKSLLVVRNLKKKVDNLIEGFSCHRKIERLIFFSFHVIILEEEWEEMTSFLSWFVSKLLTKSNTKREKNYENRFIKSLKKIFINLFGFLGTIITKFILNIPIFIQNSFKYYDYSSVFDNPQEKNRMIRLRKDCTSSYFTVVNAIRCLIIGRKYEGVFHLAFQHQDVNLCAFALSLGIKNQIKGKEIPSMTNYLFTVITQLLPANSDKLPFTDTLFLIEQLLYLSVVEGLEDLLILSLRKCLSEIESLMEALPVIVPFEFSLPSPPLFCPQINTTYPASGDEESKSEMFIREKLSRWITSFCLLCVAANVDGLIIKDTVEKELKHNMKKKYLNQFYSSFLDGKENLSLKNDSQWIELKRIWRRLFECFYSLYARDGLSLSVRIWIEAKRDMCKIKRLQEASSVVLEKSDRISALKNCWESDAFFIVLTSALEAPSIPETAHIVARNVARQPQIPSLAKGKLDKMLTYWKSFHVFPDEGQYGDGYDKINLFDLYEQYLNVEKESCASKDDSSGPLTFSEEDIKMIYLFFTMTFKSYRAQYHKFERQYPLLQQFSNIILESEFEVMNDKFLSIFLMIQKYKMSKCENFKFDVLLNKNILLQKRGLFQNCHSKFLSESSSGDIAKIYISVDRTSSRKLKKSKSFSVLESKSQNNVVLSKSKSFSNARNDGKSRKVTFPWKFSEKNSSLSFDFTKLISEVFKFCAFEFSYEPKFLRQEFLNFCAWFLWTDKNYNMYSNSGKCSVVSYFRTIFSAEDMTQTFIWHYNSKRNENGTNTIGEINSKYFRQSEFPVVPDNVNEKKSITRNPSVEGDECNHWDKRKKSKDSSERKDINLNENTDPNCAKVSPVSDISNSSENMKSLSDSGNKNGTENKNVGFWQPFLVANSISEPNYPSDVNLQRSCNNSAVIETNVNGAKNKMTCTNSNNFVTGANNCDFSTTQANDTSRVSSLPCDISPSDNTLNDFTLPDSFPEQDVNKNSDHFETFTDCPLIEKQKNLQPSIEVNNLTFLKNSLTNNIKQSKKSCIEISSKPPLMCEKPPQFPSLNVSNLMRNPEQSKIFTNEESTWVLKTVPPDLIKNTDSCQKENRHILPSKLLKAPSGNYKKSKSMTVTFNNLPTTYIQNSPCSKNTPLRLLKIPLKSEVHSNSANTEFKTLKLNDFQFSTKTSMKPVSSSINRKSSFTQTNDETHTFHSRSTQAGQTGSRITFIEHLEENKQDKIFESFNNFDSDSKLENKLKGENFQPKESIQMSKADTKLKNVSLQTEITDMKFREMSVQTKNQMLEKSTEMKGLIVESKEESTQTESKNITKDLEIEESVTQVGKINNTSVSIEINRPNVIHKATSFDSELLEQEIPLSCREEESKIDERPFLNLQAENVSSNVIENNSVGSHYSSNFEVDNIENTLNDNDYVKEENSECDNTKGSDENNLFKKDLSADSLRNSPGIYDEQNISTLTSDCKYSEKILDGEFVDENLSRSISDKLSSTSLDSKPKSLNDILGLFLTGTIQVEEVFELISASNELAKLIEKQNEDNLNEPTSKLLKIFANNVYAAKMDIEETRTLFDKVDSIAKNALNDAEKYLKNESKKIKSNVLKQASTSKQFDDQIVEFVQNVSHNNLTQNDILMLMNYIENEKETGGQRHSYLEEHLTRCSSTLTPNTQSEILCSDFSDRSHIIKSDIDHVLRTCEKKETKQDRGYSYLNLPLHKFGLSGRSSVSADTPSEFSNSNKEIRKKQIREFMKRKRLEKTEESKINSLVQKDGLTSREIRQMNQNMKGNRLDLKRKHSEIRKEECLLLLSDHFREKSFVGHILNSQRKSVTHIDSKPQNKNYSKEKPDHRILKRKTNDCNASPSRFSQSHFPRKQIERFSDYLKSIKPMDKFLYSKSFIRSKSRLGIHPSKSNPDLSSTIRSLDRISEIDSSSSHSATLTDSSWSLPDDVKKILFNGNGKIT